MPMISQSRDGWPSARAVLFALVSLLMMAFGAGGAVADGPSWRNGVELAQAAPAAAPAVEAPGELPLLRRQYMEEVSMLAEKAEGMRVAGATPEEIARAVHADRRALGVKYKNLTAPDLLETIYARNQERYGDKLGPTVEWLRARGKSWDDIIKSASRTGGKDLGF